MTGFLPASGEETGHFRFCLPKVTVLYLMNTLGKRKADAPRAPRAVLNHRTHFRDSGDKSMATKPEEQTAAEIVKKHKAIQQQDKDVSNKQPPPAQVPAGNPREHPSRQTR